MARHIEAVSMQTQALKQQQFEPQGVLDGVVCFWFLPGLPELRSSALGRVASLNVKPTTQFHIHKRTHIEMNTKSIARCYWPLPNAVRKPNILKCCPTLKPAAVNSSMVALSICSKKSQSCLKAGVLPVSRWEIILKRSPSVAQTMVRLPRQATRMQPK